MSNRTTLVVGAALALTLALPSIQYAKDRAPRDWTVHFGQPQPQTNDPAPVGAAVTHFLAPNDLTIREGDTVTFVVNGGGHGIAVHRVARKTTREDIAEDLCDGATAENPDPIVDRRVRAALCNGTVVTNGITGTQNLNYDITDAKGDLAIVTGVNTATTTNPRVDDTAHSERHLATSGRAPADDTTAPAAVLAGAFLAGSAVTPAVTAGQRIQVKFSKGGRYLVICMNRGHLLNDHMFGFVTVGDDDEDDEEDHD